MMYRGDLDVSNNDFILLTERLSIQEDAIHFVFSGYDGDEPFSAEGTAIRSELGFFLANDVSVDYQNYDTEDTATIRLNIGQVCEETCVISGHWNEGGGTWQFSGELERYIPNQ